MEKRSEFSGWISLIRHDHPKLWKAHSSQPKRCQSNPSVPTHATCQVYTICAHIYPYYQVNPGHFASMPLHSSHKHLRRILVYKPASLRPREVWEQVYSIYIESIRRGQLLQQVPAAYPALACHPFPTSGQHPLATGQLLPRAASLLHPCPFS